MDIAALHSLAGRPVRDGLHTVLVERCAQACGLMAPLHTHAEAETYYVLAGALTIFAGDDVATVAEGESVVVAAGVARTLRVDSDGARWLVATRTSSPAHLEHFGRALAPPAPSSVTDDFAALSGIVASAGIDVLGPPGTLPSGQEQLIA